MDGAGRVGETRSDVRAGRRRQREVRGSFEAEADRLADLRTERDDERERDEGILPLDLEAQFDQLPDELVRSCRGHDVGVGPVDPDTKTMWLCMCTVEPGARRSWCRPLTSTR